MKVYMLVLAFVVSVSCLAQQQPAQLIIRGDDMGYTHSGNLALIDCYKNGIQQSIEVIVPSPWFPEAVKMLNANPGADVGIHLAITSEWENVKWRPLTDCKSIRDSNGYFFPMVSANKNYPGQSILEHAWKLADIEMEFRAQIELALKLIPRISHLSSHMGCTHLAPEVAEMTRRLAKEYRIPVDPEPRDIVYVTYDGPKKTTAEKMGSFIKMLDKLEPGKTYLFLDHPGLNDAELQSVFHIGYEDVATDRQGVTELFTSKVIRDLINKKGIRLIAYRDLATKPN